MGCYIFNKYYQYCMLRFVLWNELFIRNYRDELFIRNYRNELFIRNYSNELFIRNYRNRLLFLVRFSYSHFMVYIYWYWLCSLLTCIKPRNIDLKNKNHTCFRCLCLMTSEKCLNIAGSFFSQIILFNNTSDHGSPQ
jgi:hypothetical protein